MRFRFAEFELDTDRCALSRGGESVPLARKLYALLLVLVRERHRVVPFDEVMARIWPDVHVSNATLSSTLRDLRRAIGDEGYHPSIIETVRGQGLRFLPFVEATRTAGALPDADWLFASREQLAARLCTMLDGVRAGRGRIALISGEAGMGKTRVSSELAERARLRGFTVQVGRCADSVRDPP